MITNNKVKETLLLNGFNLVKTLLNEKEEFRLIIWNNNDWNEDLPEEIMEKYPLQLIIDVKGYTLENSYVFNENVILGAVFDEYTKYSKILYPEDIIAIIDTDGHPVQINSFSRKKASSSKTETKYKTKKDLMDYLESVNIPKEAALRSFKVFFEHNPEKFKAVKK